MQQPQRLIPMALVSGLTLVWALSPGVPIRVKGAAVLLEPGSREGIYARSAGQIQQLRVQVGTVVSAGQPVATINRIDLEKVDGQWQGASLRMAARVSGYQITAGHAERGRNGGRIGGVQVVVRAA